jgi:hypothetical protein
MSLEPMSVQILFSWRLLTAAKSPAITKSIDATFQHRLIAANAVVAQDGEVNAFVPGQQMAVVVFWSCPKQMAVSHGSSVPLD